MKEPDIFEPGATYGSVDDINVLSLIEMVRKGINYSLFVTYANKSPFSLNEWSSFLHISERTMQRYKREKRTLDALLSEKFLEIALLFNKGTGVFGNTEKFNSWIETENLAMGKIKPKMLLDSSFGINLLKDELTRIEYGVLA